MKTEKERMLAGDLYRADDRQLAKEMRHGRRLTRIFNQTTEVDNAFRAEVLTQLFKKVGPNHYIEPPFHTDYGINTTIGQNFYADYDAIFVDCAPITIGNNVFMGPRVGLYTAGHPIDALVRRDQLAYAKPITIGNDVWLGGNVVVNPGVTIGDNVVVGSGSVVTEDIPANVVAVGNPCRVLRPITEADRIIWQRQKAAYFADQTNQDDA